MRRLPYYIAPYVLGAIFFLLGVLLLSVAVKATSQLEIIIEVLEGLLLFILGILFILMGKNEKNG